MRTPNRKFAHTIRKGAQAVSGVRGKMRRARFCFPPNTHAANPQYKWSHLHPRREQPPRHHLEVAFVVQGERQVAAIAVPAPPSRRRALAARVGPRAARAADERGVARAEVRRRVGARRGRGDAGVGAAEDPVVRAEGMAEGVAGDAAEDAVGWRVVGRH